MGTQSVPETLENLTHLDTAVCAITFYCILSPRKLQDTIIIIIIGGGGGRQRVGLKGGSFLSYVRPYDHLIKLLDRSYKWRISLTSGKGRSCPYSFDPSNTELSYVFILATVRVNA